MIAALFDGDDGGKARLEALKVHNLPSHQLTKNTTIEDHLTVAGKLYLEALIRHVQAVSSRGAEEIKSGLTSSFAEKFRDGQRVTVGLAKWAREAGQEVGELLNAPSPVGIAREYGLLLDEVGEEELKPGQRFEALARLGVVDRVRTRTWRQTVDRERILEP